MSNELVKVEEVESQDVPRRTITIKTSRGESTKIAFEGEHWFQLKELLEKGGTDVNGERFDAYNLSNMKPVESINKGTLEHPEALVPNSNFILFLMPYKSKSGSTSSEVRASIKSLIERDGEAAKAHFNADKSYTNKSTATLEALLESYAPGTKAKVSKEKATAIAEVVSSVKESKEEDLLEQLQGLSTDEKLDIVIKLLVELRSGVTSPTVAVAVSAPVKSQKEIDAENKAEEDRKQAEEERQQAEAKAKAEAEAKAEKKRLQKEEDAKLDAELRNMAKGFNDVRL